MPAILQRTPYDKEGAALRNYSFEVMRAVQAGYACVVQDTRGRYRSDGVWHWLTDDGAGATLSGRPPTRPCRASPGSTLRT